MLEHQRKDRKIKKVKLEKYFKKNYKKFPPEEMDKVEVTISYEAPPDATR